MKQIHRAIISVIVILMLATTIVYAKDHIDKRIKKITVEDRKAIPEEKIPIVDVQNQMTSEQTLAQETYTDMWTFVSTALTYSDTETGYPKTIEGMKQTITLKYPSTITVFVTSEVAGTVYLRALLDNSLLGPGQVYFNIDNDDTYEWQTNSFNFRRKWVSAGTHEIKLQQSENGALWYKSMIIIANGYKNR